MDENERKNDIDSRDRFTPNNVFFLAVKLVSFGIILYVILTHLSDLSSVVSSILSLVSPLLIGCLIALILNTPMMALEKLINRIAEKRHKKISRRACESVSLSLTFIIALLIIYILCYSIFPQLGESVKTIYQKAQSNFPKMLEWLEGLEKYGINTTPVVQWLDNLDTTEIVKKLSEYAVQFADKLTSSLSSIISGASSIISGIFTALTSIIFAAYILSNKRKLKRQLKEMTYAYIRKKTADMLCEICALSVKTFSNFISGQCLECIILGTMFFIAMNIFGFPYPLAISSLIAATAIIPYIGAFLGCFFGMLLMIIDDPIKSVWFLVMFLIIQQLENNLIYPRVVGGSVGLPPIWTFAAVIIGGGVCGIIGMILFIPLFSVLYTLLRENVHSRLDTRGIVIEKDDDDSVVKKNKRDIGGEILLQAHKLYKSAEVNFKAKTAEMKKKKDDNQNGESKH
jgi:predicted PurR-regulated permease PerM